MGIYLVTVKSTWLGQECRNTFYYESTPGEPSNSEWQDMCDEIRNTLASELVSALVDVWKFYGIDRRRVDTAGLLTFSEVPTGGDLFGAIGSDSAPTQIALLVSVKGTSTKPNRARTYLPGWGDVSVVNSLFTVTPRGAAVDWVDAMSHLNVGGTNTLDRVAAQWNSGHTSVVATNDISTATPVASAVPATQRRRRIGVGI